MSNEEPTVTMKMSHFKSMEDTLDGLETKLYAVSQALKYFNYPDIEQLLENLKKQTAKPKQLWERP